MNYSEIKPQIYAYLGMRGNADGGKTDGLISECLSELDGLVSFRYINKKLDELPTFLQKDPYISFIEGFSCVFLSVTTLGAEVDRRIKLLSRTDMAKAVVFDACASALLEHLSDEYEKSLGDSLTSRFCPGYGGSDVSDLKYIFEILRPERIGVTISDGFYMLPSKSMAGIVGIGKRAEKSCGGCILLKNCAYRKEGGRCYGSEKK